MSIAPARAAQMVEQIEREKRQAARPALISRCELGDKEMVFHLSDGRTVKVPLPEIDLSAPFVPEPPNGLFQYRGVLYPEYIRRGNAMRFAEPFARQFCRGRGLDIGAGDWPLPGALAIDMRRGGDALDLPQGPWDYIFSSHCLEHLTDPVAALEHWHSALRPGGVLFLYLPHCDMEYWLPQYCRKHRHSWRPGDMAQMLRDLGFGPVIHSERDLAWSFAVVGWG